MSVACAGVWPQVVQARPDQGLDDLLELLRADYRRDLLTAGATLLRGFGCASTEAFERAATEMSGRGMAYKDGNSPRSKLSERIYTSTEYPAEYFISLHNELSYSHSWPEILAFCCVVPAAHGGETVIADSRALLTRLDQALVDEFVAKQVQYVRNLHGGVGVGKSWADTFETHDHATVEAYCRDAGITCTWTADDGVRLTSVRPATMRHPRTGDDVWFNQADQFHPTTHPPEVYEMLMTLYAGREDDLPQYARFGDGTEIPPAYLEEVRAVQRRLMIPVQWQSGDVLVLDNVLVCHGRQPYTGARRVLVAMS